jgi:hypothetical protein
MEMVLTAAANPFQGVSSFGFSAANYLNFRFGKLNEDTPHYINKFFVRHGALLPCGALIDKIILG